jgi:hypothetical protein
MMRKIPPIPKIGMISPTRTQDYDLPNLARELHRH